MASTCSGEAASRRSQVWDSSSSKLITSSSFPKYNGLFKGLTPSPPPALAPGGSTRGFKRRPNVTFLRETSGLNGAVHTKEPLVRVRLPPKGIFNQRRDASAVSPVLMLIAGNYKWRRPMRTRVYCPRPRVPGLASATSSLACTPSRT